MAPSTVKLISYSEEIVDGQPIFVASNCLPFKATNFEPAGHAFHSAALKLSGQGEEEEDANSDNQTEASDKEQTSFHSFDSNYSGKGKKKAGESKQQDHYALLGLSHLRYLATEDQIKKSYRETALKYHPDKQAALLLLEETEDAKQAKKDEIETHFKAIQEAYEVLIDPIKRRIYDSSDEFDDEIPTDCAPQDFFKVFGPAFMRNGRWSVAQPIPSLGTDSTPIKEVDRFYDFWYTFKSWREFPHTDEFDVEQAESRDHKRWMERQNAKITEKARKEEYARIRTLVDNAYKRDPRILRRKDEEKAEKQRKKEAKVLAKKQQEEEAIRKIEEEKKRKEEEARQAAEAALLHKKVKEKEKKLLRKERSRLRALSVSVVSQRLLGISDDVIDSICLALDMEQLRSLCDKMESGDSSARAELIRKTGGLDDKVEDVKQAGKQQSQKQNGSAPQANGSLPFSSTEKKEKPWGKEEIEMLRKGMQKYPKGTSRRWEVISEYIGTGRSVEEILKATKTVLLQKPDSAKAFDSFLEKRKPAKSIDSPLSTREELEGTATATTAAAAAAPAPAPAPTPAPAANSDNHGSQWAAPPPASAPSNNGDNHGGQWPAPPPAVKVDNPVGQWAAPASSINSDNHGSQWSAPPPGFQGGHWAGPPPVVNGDNHGGHRVAPPSIVKGDGYGAYDKLYVGGISKQALKKEIEDIFSPYGILEDVFIARDEMKQNRCAFIKYSHRDMALAAIKSLNGTFTMRGCELPLIVRFADPKKPKTGDPRSAANHGEPMGVFRHNPAQIMHHRSGTSQQPINQGVIDPWSVSQPFPPPPPPQLYQGPAPHIGTPEGSQLSTPLAAEGWKQSDITHKSNLNLMQQPSSKSPRSGLNPQTAASTSTASTVPSSAENEVFLECDWSQHICPDGDKYYYNSVTFESTWEKPDEFAKFEQELEKQQKQQNAGQYLHSTSPVSAKQVGQPQQTQLQSSFHQEKAQAEIGPAVVPACG